VTVGNLADGRGTKFVHNNGDYYSSNSLSIYGTPQRFRMRKNRPIPLSPGAIEGNVRFHAIASVRPIRLNAHGSFGSNIITYVAEIRNF
jgi:hypothetical protein